MELLVSRGSVREKLMIFSSVRKKQMSVEFCILFLQVAHKIWLQCEVKAYIGTSIELLQTICISDAFWVGLGAIWNSPGWLRHTYLVLPFFSREDQCLVFKLLNALTLEQNLRWNTLIIFSLVPRRSKFCFCSIIYLLTHQAHLPKIAKLVWSHHVRANSR